MEAVVEKKYIETEEDVKNIMKGIEDVKNGKVMDVDSAMKKFFYKLDDTNKIVNVLHIRHELQDENKFFER